ncbi:tetraacyldisaccharide 4'-kinase [Methylovirgula sp. 4M-Z18]|uniref:tetraacyldisaccharide 4'-kinase n=1 Tax=Methylovirgula sp. 4M-Z18 TaxID=2293567 RepID=UPI000E2ED436|nr:tetraacyldisaccharide 4'-kinase [Methylovirgula sp. 4M-Z18]RFB78833.1 tetraacyldisaccharide 4'-kinase [Methylovirgula sp. 4M-Z18]
MKQAPDFWWQSETGPLARTLTPLGKVYGAITARRMAKPGWRARVPVICIGNFVAGGAGKTPTAIALAHLLQQMGERVVFLSRGHGGARRSNPLIVDPSKHSARDVGDEPLLLARVAPVVVTPDRVAGAHLAEAQGASVIVMDDGMQNPSLTKTLTFAVVDGASGVGNGLCIPAGPLRAPLDAQMRYADALIMIGELRGARPLAQAAQTQDKPVLRGRLMPNAGVAERLDGARVIAFAGIGRPEKFFDTVSACGATVLATRAFADHHAFSAIDRVRLERQAEQQKALLVTTEKDAVRLPKDFPALALPVELEFLDKGAVKALLNKVKGR